jgi:hypothetical protein
LGEVPVDVVLMGSTFVSVAVGWVELNRGTQ